jgi:SnoaL-like polyketide cyclase
VLELSAAGYQEPVEARAANAADPAFHVRVRVRRSHRRANDLDAVSRQDGVEDAREHGIAVMDKEPNLPLTIVELHQQVARLLKHPSGFRTAAGDVLDTAATDRKEDEHVDTTQPDRVYREEVAGENRLADRVSAPHALDDAWNAEDLEIFKARHKPDVIVGWPGQPEPTGGIEDHTIESQWFWEAFPDQHLVDRPYRIFFASGDYTCGQVEDARVKIE